MNERHTTHKLETQRAAYQAVVLCVPDKIEELFQLYDSLHGLELEVAAGVRQRMERGPLGQEMDIVLVDVVARSIKVIPRHRHQRQLGQELRFQLGPPAAYMMRADQIIAKCKF